MSGVPELAAATLARYFERKLTVAGDTLRCEPNGYMTEVDHSTDYTVVLRHVASNIRCCADPIDLVERVDFRNPGQACRVLYVYVEDMALFAKVGKIARTQGREALGLLIASGVLQPAIFADGEKEADEGTWVGPFTTVEPMIIRKRASASPGATLSSLSHRGDEPWFRAQLLFAFFVPSVDCRTSGYSEDIIEFRVPKAAAPLQVDYGHALVEAAMRRDVAECRSLLAKGANPNAVDSAGWTALHRVVYFKRPCWALFDMLTEVADVTKRNNDGWMPVDLAEQCNQKEVADALRECMIKHPKGKHLVRASPSNHGSTNDYGGQYGNRPGLEDMDLRIIGSPTVPVREGLFMKNHHTAPGKPNIYGSP